MASADDRLNQELRSLSGKLTDLVGIMSEPKSGDGTRQGTLDRRGDNAEASEKARSKAAEKLAEDQTAMGASIANAMSTISGGNKILSRSAEEHAEMFAKLKDQNLTDAEFASKMNQHYGFTVSKAGTSVEDFRKKMEETLDVTVDSIEEFDKELKASSRTISEHTAEFMKNHKGLALFLQTLKLVAKESYDVAKAATRTGGEVTALQMASARALGMSHADLIVMTSKYSQTMGSAEMGTDDFTKMMNKNALEMVQYTGSTKDAAEMAAYAAQQYKLSGGEGAEGMKTFISANNEQFKEFQAMTGGTVEEFNNLNTALRNNATTQTAMYKMSKKQRLEYMNEMKVRRNLLLADGLRAEQADAVIDAMSAAQGGTAKDRMKNAAKLQASLGAMGMGAEGQEAADILRKGSRASADEQTRMQEIMKNANMEAGRRGGGSLQAEMVQDHLNGLNPLMGPESPFVAVVTQLTNALKNPVPPESSDAERQALGAVVAAGDALVAAKQDNLIQAITGAIGGVLTITLPGIVAGMFASGSGALATLTARLAAMTTALSGAAAGSALLIGKLGMVGAAFAAGWWVGTKINDYIDAEMPEVGEAIGGTLNEMVESFKDGSWVSDTADFWGGQVKDLATGAANMINDTFEDLAPDAKKSVDGTLQNIFGSLSDGSLLSDAASYWGDMLGFGGDDDEKLDPNAPGADESILSSMWGNMFGDKDKDEDTTIKPIASVATELEALGKAIEKTPEQQKAALEARQIFDEKALTVLNEMKTGIMNQYNAIKTAAEESAKVRNEEKEEAKELTTALGKTAMSAR